MSARAFGLDALVAIAPAEENGWRVDHDALRATFPIVDSFAGVIQDLIHHAEGDVAIHTRMVLERLAAHAPFRALALEERALVMVACLLHDVAKPVTTTTDEDGRVRARGHSQKGAIVARRLLWELGVPFAQRELVSGLVRYHQAPFFLALEDERVAERRALRIAEACRCDLLEIVAWADAAGRTCEDQERLLSNVALFGLLTEELGVRRAPFAFDSDHTRFRYFKDERRTRHDTAFDDTAGELVLLVGFPAAGKDQWCRAHAGDDPVVSLDRIRAMHDIPHGGPQGRTVDLAFEELKQALREKRRVIYNATNLIKDLRDDVIALADAYGARVRIVILEAAPDTLEARNRARAEPVPASVYARMAERWDVPDRSQAHAIEVLVTDAARGR